MRFKTRLVGCGVKGLVGRNWNESYFSVSVFVAFPRWEYCAHRTHRLYHLVGSCDYFAACLWHTAMVSEIHSNRFWNRLKVKPTTLFTSKSMAYGDPKNIKQHVRPQQTQVVLRSWRVWVSALSVGAIQRSLKLWICLDEKYCRFIRSQSTKKPYRAIQIFLLQAMTTAKVGIVFNCRDSESYHVLPVAVSVDCVTNLKKIHSLCHDHVTVAFSCTSYVGKPCANETWQAGDLDSWTPGVWAEMCWHCGQDLVPARLPIRDPIYCQVASHSADQLVRNAFFMPAGGRRTTKKLTATSWVFILWSDLFPSRHPLGFPLIPLSRSDKININQHTRALWSMLTNFFTPRKTHKRLANCNVFTNIVGNTLVVFILPHLDTLCRFPARLVWYHVV